MKVSIIGGGGRVGSNTAFALQCGGVINEVLILDVNHELAKGEVLDLLHGTAFMADQKFTVGTYADAAKSDVIVISAGLRRKPEESRLDLMNRNVGLFRDILIHLKQESIQENAILMVVSNPVDVLTQIAVETSGLPFTQVLGLGTMLDTARFSSLIAAELKLAPTQVKALVLGEHGDSQVCIWSSASVNGLPVTKLPGFTPSVQKKIAERTKTGGAEALRLKGGAGYAVAIAVREVVHAIALDRQSLLPVSSLQQGCYGVNGICLSVPTVVGRNGVIRTVELEITESEKTGLQRSAGVLKEFMAQVKPA
jgi:L-lactate dehydrogenase